MTPVHKKELTIEEMARAFSKLVELAHACGFVVMMSVPETPKK